MGDESIVDGETIEFTVEVDGVVSDLQVHGLGDIGTFDVDLAGALRLKLITRTKLSCSTGGQIRGAWVDAQLVR